MTPHLSLVSDGKKFMWDGRTYESADEATKADDTYRRDGFDVRTIDQDGRFFIYTRKALNQVVPGAQ